MNTEDTPPRQTDISRREGLLADAIRNFLRYACDLQDYRNGHAKRNQALVELERHTQWFHERNIPIQVDYKSGWLSVKTEKQSL